MIEYKRCPECKELFEKNTENFYNNKNTKDKLSCYCRKCNKIKRLEQYKRNPLITHENNIKRLYGITYEDYLELLEKQNHKCAICHLTLEKSNPFIGRGKAKHFNIDHDHNTGKIRGLLCNNCNQGLGRFKHNLQFLKKAIKYLEKNNIVEL